MNKTKKAVYDLFREMAESLRDRKESETYDKEDLLRGAAALRSAADLTKKSSEEDAIIREFASKALQSTKQYPSKEPWSGADLSEILNVFAEYVEKAGNNKPVRRDYLEDALEFCTEVRFKLGIS